MAVFHGYFDESGKSHQHSIVSFSGFVSTWESWQEMCVEWQRLLREYGIKAVHFKEPKRRTSTIKKFIRLIKRKVEFGMAAAMDVDSFRNLPESLRRKVGNDPHYLIFKCVLLGLANNVYLRPGDTLNFVCDEDEATNQHLFSWYKQLKRQEDGLGDKIASFCVADDRHFPQLQASDIFAALTRAAAERKLAMGLMN